MSNRPNPKDLLKRRKGAPTFNFPNEVNKKKDTLISGSEIEGKVVDTEVTQQTDPENDYAPKFWNDDPEKPMWQLVVTLATDLRDDAEDDGKRRIFAKYKLLDAISDACEEAGVDNLEIGGYLHVVHDDIIPPDKPTRSATKLYTAKYTPVKSTILKDGGGDPEKEPAIKAKATEPKEDESDGIDADAAAAVIAALTPAQRKAIGLA